MITTLTRRDDPSSSSVDRDSQSFALFCHPIDNVNLSAIPVIEIGVDLITTILALELAENIPQRHDIAFVSCVAGLVGCERIAQLRLRQAGHNRHRERENYRRGSNFFHHDHDMLKSL